MTIIKGHSIYTPAIIIGYHDTLTMSEVQETDNLKSKIVVLHKYLHGD